MKTFIFVIREKYWFSSLQLWLKLSATWWHVNFIQNETQRSQVNHSGGYGVEAGSSPKPGKNHTPYFPAGPCEGEMLLTSLAPWGWFLLEEKKKKILDFVGFCFGFFVFFLCCIPNPWPTFTVSPDWICKLLVQPFSFSSLPLSSPFPGIGSLPAFDNRLMFTIHHHPIPPSTFT